MSNILAGMIPVDNSDKVDDFVVVNCGVPASDQSPSGDTEILYPTSEDVDVIDGSTVPMGVQGGTILKMPAPTGCVTDGTNKEVNDRTKALFSFFSDLNDVISDLPDVKAELGEKGLEKAKGDASDELGLAWSEGRPGGIEAHIAKAKMAINNGLLKVASKGNTQDIPNLFKLFLAQSKESGLPEEGVSISSKRFVEFVYVPIEVLGHVSKKVGDAFGSVRSSTGVTYSSMGERSFATDLAKLLEAKALKLGEGDGDDSSSAADLLDAFPIDVIGLIMGLLGIANGTVSPVDVLEIPCLPIDAANPGTSTCAEIKNLTAMLDLDIKDPDWTADEVVESAFKVAEGLDDAHIRDLLLEYVPIFNVSNDDITGGGRKAKRLAFFTVYNDSVYLKMPDISGMDSNGFSDDIYKTDGEFSKFLYFEVVKSGKVTRSSFQFQPMPCVSFSEYETGFPDPDGGENFVLTLDGEVENIRAVYLSPVVPISGDVKSAPGFAERVSDAESGIEMFTAPLLTKPIIINDNRSSMYTPLGDGVFDDFDNLQKSISSSIAGELSNLYVITTKDEETLSIEAQSFDGQSILAAAAGAADAFSDVQREVDTNHEAKFDAEAALDEAEDSGDAAAISNAQADLDIIMAEASEADLESSALEDASKIADELVLSKGAKIDVDIIDIGFPIDNMLATSSFDSLSHILGYKSRPDVFCSDMDGVPREPLLGDVRKNNKNIHSPKFSGSSALMVGTRPKFCGSESIPALWISAGDLEVSGDSVEATFDKDKFKYLKRKNISFAVYAVDSLGQIFRVPDQYINLSVEPPDLESVTKNGCGFNSMTIFDPFELSLDGTNFRKTIKSDGVITFVASDGQEISIRGTNLDIQVVSAEKITLSSEKTAASFGFLAKTYYEVYVDDVLNTIDPEEPSKSDAYKPIIFKPDSSEGNYPCPSEKVKLGPNKIRPTMFSSKDIIEGIPLTQDGTSVEVRLKSSASIFVDDSILYAYLAFDASIDGVSDVLDDFSFEETRLKAQILDKDENPVDVIIPYNVEYEFGSGDFSRDEFAFFNKKKKSILKFPGDKYKHYNFSSLLNLEKCYILVISDSKITDIGLDNATHAPIDKTKHCAVQVGDTTTGKEKIAFTSKPYVIGMLSSSGSAYSQTLGVLSKNDISVVEDVFGEGSASKFKHEGLGMSEKMSTLMVVFRGVRHRLFARWQFKFYIDSSELNGNIKGLISGWDGNSRPDELYVVFKDVVAPKSGILDIYVENLDSKFYSSGYNGKILIKEATTAIIPIVGSDPVDDGLITPASIEKVETDAGPELKLTLAASTSECTGPKCGDGWSGPRAEGANVGTVMFSELGLPINKADAEYLKSPKTSYTLLNDISLSVESGLTVGGDEVSDSGTEIDSISLTSLSVPSGAKFYWSEGNKTSSFFTDNFPPSLGSKYAKASVRTEVSNHSSISAGLLTIDSIEVRGERVDNDGSKNAMRVDAVREVGNTIVLLVTSPTPNVSASAKPKDHDAIKLVLVHAAQVFGEGGGKDKWKFTFRPPSGEEPGAQAYIDAVSVQSETGCITITATAQNSARIDAVQILGEPAVLDPFATMKRKTGSGGFKFHDFPDPVVPELSLPGNFKLKKPMVPPALIKDICDFSFHLTADLQLSLGNFQILLIPIQCIFRIIDVLCAILNPWKMATALIRLFECLFDLICLIPQLSVPVMFLNLILHLLEIIMCIIEKILFVIKAVNVIVPAVKAAVVSPVDWNAIANLESVLSEYLLDMETDLEFLAPISSILGIFLELLQLIFRFPCQINSTGGDFICGLDGTLLAGLARGKAIPSEGSIDVSYLVPVAQAYGTDGEVGGTSSMWGTDCGYFSLDSEPYIPDAGSTPDTYGSIASDGSFLTNLDIESEHFTNTYRGNSSDGDDHVTFTVSCTKSVRAGGDPKIAKFVFNSRADPFCIPVPPPISGIPITKNIYYNNPADFPFMLFDGSSVGSGSQLTAKKDGQFVSPKDGYKFLNSSGGSTVKDLEVTFSWIEMKLNIDTGEVEETEVTRTKTFDGVPSLVILDENGDMYFIQEINWSDGMVESIKARIVSQDTAPKLKFAREDETITDPGPDGVVDEYNEDGELLADASSGPGSDGLGKLADDETPAEEADDISYDVKVFEFPQIYFFDMRQLEAELEEMCTGPNIVDAVLEDAADDDFTNIVQAAKDCIDLFTSLTKEQAREVYNDLVNGEVPDIIDVEQYALNAQEMIECLEEAASASCKYAISPLTTTFKVLEDDDDTDLEEFVTPDGVDPEILDDHLEDWEETGPDMTGATEYASGDGDSAALMVGETANIVVIPRDIYDGEIGADFTDKIEVTIISDSTGSASLKEFPDDEGNVYFVEKHDDGYRAELTANDPGVVRIKASICDKTIQALTYAAISKDIYSTTADESLISVDCFPDEFSEDSEDSDTTSSNFNLTRVDRVLTISYNKSTAVSTATAEDAGLTPRTTPQAFGTKLEN